MTVVPEPDNITIQKKELRRHMGQVRQSASDAHAEAGLKLAEQASELLSAHAAGAVIAGYWPYRSEIDPRALMSGLQAKGAQLCLPITGAEGTPLRFHHFSSEAQLVSGKYGILQPSSDSPLLIPDILLVPLLAIDTEGYRLGYGGGYYDRSLTDLTSAGHRILTIGLAFDEQLLEIVPRGAYDVPLDGLATPTSARWFAAV